MNLHDWIDELSDLLDVEVEVDEGLLDELAEVVRDNVEDEAAAVSVFLLGYAAAARRLGPEAVEALAGRATELAETWDRPAGTADGDDDVEIEDDRRIDHSADLDDAADAGDTDDSDDSDDED